MENTLQKTDIDAPEDMSLLGFSPDLLRKVEDLDLSVRTWNCMVRENIIYLGDLVRLTESEVLKIPNLGRKSFNELQYILRCCRLSFGMNLTAWPPENIEAIRNKFNWAEIDIYTEPKYEKFNTPEEPEDEATTISRYHTMGLFKKVELLGLSVRSAKGLKNDGIVYIGDLVGRSQSEILKIPNFGRKSLNELNAALNKMELRFGMELAHWPLPDVDNIAAEFNDRVAHEDEEPLHVAFARTMAKVTNPKTLLVMEARFGLKGKPRTLEDVAQELGCTRERVRQIQKKITQTILASEFWDDILRIRLSKLMSNRQEPLYLAAIGEEDSWFKGFEDNLVLLQNLLVAFSEDEKLDFLNIDGKKVIAHMSDDDWRNAKYDLINMLEQSLDNTYTMEDVELFVDSKLKQYGALELSSLLFEQINKDLNFSYLNGDMVLVSVGNALASHLRVILETSDKPLHFEEIVVKYEERYGVPISPRYVHNCLGHRDYLLFDRGTYGLPKHVSVPLHQQEAMRAKLESIILAGSPDRQWHSRDLVGHLDPSLSRGGRLDKYLVNILLKPSKSLRYLGKWSWKVKASGDEIVERLYIRKAVYEALKQAGKPLHADELQELVSQARGIGAIFNVHPSELYSRVDPSTWGLLDRDFVLTLREWEPLKSALFEMLQLRGSAFHKSELLKALKDYDLPPELTDNHVLGVMYADSRFKGWHGGFIGLVGWSSSNRKTFDAVLKEIAESTTESISADEIIERAQAVVGYEFNRYRISVYMNKHGLAYDVDSKLWKKVKYANA